VGPNEGRKAFTLQTLAPALSAPAGDDQLAKHSGFSLHAGVAAAAHQRDKVERLCRYIARPAVATTRLALTAQGQVRYTLTNRQDCRFARPKAAQRAGHRDVPGEHAVPRRHHACHVAPGILPSALRASLRLSKIAPGDFVEPLDFIARLAALVPKPRVHLTRYHGVLAPHSALRAAVTPARRGKATGITERSPAERHRAMSWAQRLKRVFRIDIEQCERCGGKVRIIASVEDPAVIGRILAHLEQTKPARGSAADLATAHRARGPPGQGEFDLN
jgi:hypothetical protein